MEDLLFIVFMIVVGSLMYSGGRNPIQYYEDQKRKESERQRLRIARDSFIAEMKDLGSDLDVSKKSKNRSEWAVAKDFFLKSNEWKNIRQEVFKKYGRQCLKCGSRSRIEVDHIVPVYDNPWLRLNFDNLQPLCHSCNSIKGTGTADYRSSYNAMSGAESSLVEDETDDIIQQLIDEFGLDDRNNLDESYQINLLVSHFKKIKGFKGTEVLKSTS
ncbi:HNH endonuclease [Pseudomonadales bacterium]|nr:HNH endonuclease [Pseudomonadales bacterium]